LQKKKLFHNIELMDFNKAQDYILNKIKSELPNYLYYHSYNHVMDVLDAAMNFANLEKVNDYDRMLLKTAVLYHDSGFTVQSKDHEAIGCDIARESLPDFGYSKDEIERICGMIMATRIPQTPHDLLEEIICDADLDYLGRDDFWDIGNNLFKELEIYGILNDEKEWNKLQLKFLEIHHYFTASALNLRKSKKDQHLDKIRQIVKSYDN